MKSVFTLPLASVFTLALVACSAPQPSLAEVRTQVLSVTGMTCAIDCPQRVRAALETVPGVASAVVDYDARTATVRHRAGTTVEALTSALLLQGFGATPE